MSTETSVIRAQIEETRASLSDNVDALSYQANPAHMAGRQVAKAKRAGSRLLDRIFGAAEDVRDNTANAAHDVASGIRNVTSGVSDLPQSAGRQAQGNPMAAGFVAFGIGLLIAAAFPATRKEEELAQAVKEQAKPLTDHLGEAAQAVAGNLAEPAKQAVDTLKVSAEEAVSAVQEEGTAAVSDVQGVASDAATEVADTARDSVDYVKEEARNTGQTGSSRF